MSVFGRWLATDSFLESDHCGIEMIQVTGLPVTTSLTLESDHCGIEMCL